jgi:hypothetical protein
VPGEHSDVGTARPSENNADAVRGESVGGARGYGAVIAAPLWLMMSAVFAFYVQAFANYGKTYVSDQGSAWLT